MGSRLIGQIVVLALWASASPAETWRLAQADSSLTFSYLENGVVIEGAFTKFDGEARLEPADLSDASVAVTVTTDSISFGDPLRDHFARSVDWFNTETFPAAEFYLTGLANLGGDRYSAAGVLEIRGTRHEVDATLTIDRRDGGLTAEGALVFPRSEFGVGTGFSALLADIGDDITVKFDLVGERID
jgi:polyisoprenoid-binding protein YceI